MFVKLNDRVYLNMAKITRMKIDHVEDGIRVRFYEGQEQVAKSKDLMMYKQQRLGFKSYYQKFK